ncbi:MAG: capsule biosynthesis GfcC family protein [Aeromonas sp.]
MHKSLKQWGLAAGLLCSALSPAFAAPSLVLLKPTAAKALITSSQAPVQIVLNEGAAVSDLLATPEVQALADQVDWSRARLSTAALDAQALAQKSALLKRLKALQVAWMRETGSGGLVQSSQQLLQELDRVKVLGRAPLALDPLLNRLSPVGTAGKNPLLSGDYQLWLAPRATQLHMLGLINGPATLPISPGQGLAHYWQAHQLLAGADLGQAYLIQPNGAIALLPVASWNERHREPMPGATLFIGFKPSVLPAEYHDINQQIAELLAHRMPE